MPAIPTIPSQLGVAGAHLAKDGGAGKPTLPEILTGLVAAAPGGTVKSNATRGAASAYSAGMMIWNTDDNAPNWSDGSAWRDAAGNIT